MGTKKPEKEASIYIDFNDRLPGELLENKVFIRLVNLEQENPLIQVNDLIFKGTYDYCLGTNLFFKKTPNEDPIEFPFKDSTKFKLDFVDAQTKVLNCKQMIAPSTTASELPALDKNIKFNFTWDYKELLKKLEQGSLDLEDMVVPNDDRHESLQNTEQNEQQPSLTASKSPHSREMSDNIDIPNIEPNKDVSEIRQINESVNKPYDELNEAYKNLQLLARTPVRSEIAHEDCPCDPRFKNEYEYRSIECKILEPPLFACTKNNKKPKSFEDCINVERCITLGLLPHSDTHPRTISDEEKNILMTVENFDNLDLQARYSVLVAYKEGLEKQVNSNSHEQNSVKDEFDRTPRETLTIFERLVSALQRRIQEIVTNT